MKSPDNKRLPWAVLLGLVCLVLGILGCVQPLPRADRVTPPAPTASPTPTPTPTPIPIPPATLRPTPRPTPLPARPPPLEIRGPANGSTVRGKAVVVHGIASPGGAVSVNGVPAQVDAEGRFLAEVSLPEGTHQIGVSAIDSLGNVVTQFITLTFEAPQAFFLLVTEPENQTVVFTRNIRLTGKTGLGALVSVNGVSIGVDAQGAFTTILTLDPGPNIIDVVSTSPDGQVLDTVLAVIYRA